MNYNYNPYRDKIVLLMNQEKVRQENTIELIASENFVSEDVIAALGSCLTNKYTEGYPAERPTGNKGRYYGGCVYYDALEQYCCELYQKVFETNYHVNVQPHSGSNANMAGYLTLLGGKTIRDHAPVVLSMKLDNGGHLTHGASRNFSGMMNDMVFYGVDKDGFIDMKDVEEKALTYHPEIILAGASAYSRVIDFKKFREIADKVGAYLMVDMAHIAGLVAAKEHPSPFGLADVITTTTHKTLRGPRGGLIFCKPELAKKVDSAIFPGIQGGPLQNVIAAKAVAAAEALEPSYKQYIHQVVLNTAAMCDEFKKLGFDIVTGGTDNHLFLIDFSKTHPEVTGKMVQEELDRHDITVNKNCVPNEQRSPVQTSGIRVGLAAMTTRGWLEADARECAQSIAKIIDELR